MRDIKEVSDIKSFVDAFYLKVRKDDVLGGIFESVIRNNWEEHLEKMVRFWQTLLFKERTYFGKPFPPHSHMPLTQLHFDRWVTLFEQTIDELYKGEMAEESKSKARMIAVIFSEKIKENQRASALQKGV